MAKYTSRQLITLIVFCVAQFCNALCISIQAPFYPKEAEEKGAVPSQYGFVFGVYELVIFIFSPIYGKYLNKIGVKVVNNTGIFTVGVTCILFGFLENVIDAKTFIAYSFIIRVIEATGTAAFTTAAFSIIAKEFPENVGSTFALLETFFGIGLILGPTIGGLLYEVGGFKLPFIVIGSLLLTAAVLIFFVLPEPEDQPDSCRSSKGLLALIRLPPIFLGASTVFSASLSVGFIQATLEPHLRPLGLTPLQLGLMFILNGSTYAISAPIWGRICDKLVSPQCVWSLGALFISAAFILIGPAPFLPINMSLPIIIVALIIHGLGIGSELVATFSAFHKDAVCMGFPDNINTYGMVSGLWTSSFALGAFVGPSAAGVLYDTIGFPWASQMVVVIHLLLFFTTGIYILFFKKKYSVLYRRISEMRLSIDDETTPVVLANEFIASYGSTNPSRDL